MAKRIGIRYCGGCNPRYDRVAAVERLQRDFPQYRWELAEADTEQSLRILVCGCEAACVSAEDLRDAPLLSICGEADLHKMREALEGL